MPTSDEQFQLHIIRKIAEAAADFARPHIPSRTLSRALNVLVLSAERARIQIPHYWALYVHDGRGPFGPVNTRPDGTPITVLCWFRNPFDDPRRRVGVAPVRERDVKHLTHEQYAYWLKRNKIARKAGLPLPMIVTPYYSKSQAGHPFFENDGGMAGFTEHVNRMFNAEVRKHILDQIRKDLHVTGKAVARL